MAETIIKGSSYYKEVNVTTREDGEEIPVDLSSYVDNYFSITTKRGLPDSKSIVFDKIVASDPAGGLLTINLTPETTSMLPLTTRDMPYLYGFVQIGSIITGQVHEVASFKIKTKDGGIAHITPIDKSYDMGCLKEEVGWIFDAGNLCETVTMIEKFGDDNGIIVFNAGRLNTDSIEIIDFGRLDLNMPDITDFGSIRLSKTFC